MDASPPALPVVRILLGMADRSVTGTLALHAGPRCFRVALRGGRIYGVEGTSHRLLGDLLAAQHTATPTRSTVADAPAARAIGSWLVETGAVTAHELGRALCSLHIERLRWLFGHAELRIGSLTTLPPLGAQLRASLPLDVAVLDAFLRAEELPLTETELVHVPSLSARGTRLVHALVRHRQRNAEPATMRSATAEERARLATVLRDLALCTRIASTRSYSTLLRKRCELAQRRAPTRLLDVVEAPTQADVRRKLRVLAGRLHPDLFACSAPSLAPLAGEVLAGLTRAADTLLSPPTPTSQPAAHASR